MVALESPIAAQELQLCSHWMSADLGWLKSKRGSEKRYFAQVAKQCLSQSQSYCELRRGSRDHLSSEACILSLEKWNLTLHADQLENRIDNACAGQLSPGPARKRTSPALGRIAPSRSTHLDSPGGRCWAGIQLPLTAMA